MSITPGLILTTVANKEFLIDYGFVSYFRQVQFHEEIE